MKNLLLVLFLTLGWLFLIGCQTENNPSEDIANEYWKGHVHTDRVDIPFRFRLSDSTLVLINSQEEIKLSISNTHPDSVSYSFPFYDAELTVYLPLTRVISGTWKSFSRNFQLPFTAEVYEPSSSVSTDSLYSQITFLSPDSSKSFQAIGAFLFGHQRLSGTFLTETGDYRFMEGTRDGNNFNLSTFDGDHLYFAKATIDTENNISGTFHSGNNPPYTWSGYVTNTPSLTPADEITLISRPDSTLYFSAQTLNGDSFDFGPQQFYGNVTIVSAFGSWCPNCHDELRMYSELSSTLDNHTFKIIPVAFERQESAKEARPVVLKVINGIEAPFEAFYAGKASKSFASRYFDGIGEIKAFPTSVIIDKRGKIRKVYSGFSGPGTGHYYQKHKEEVYKLISQLLAEK